jgi:hypothetical protein
VPIIQSGAVTMVGTRRYRAFAYPAVYAWAKASEMGQSCHPGHDQPLPNYPGKQTFSAPAGMSEKCPTAGIHHGGGNVSLVPESPGILSGPTIAMRKQFRPTIKGYDLRLVPRCPTGLAALSGVRSIKLIF